MKITIISYYADLYGSNPKESRLLCEFLVAFAEGDLRELRGSITAKHCESHAALGGGQIKWGDPSFPMVTLSAKLAQAVKSDVLKILETWIFGGGKCEG